MNDMLEFSTAVEYKAAIKALEFEINSIEGACETAAGVEEAKDSMRETIAYYKRKLKELEISYSMSL